MASLRAGALAKEWPGEGTWHGCTSLAGHCLEKSELWLGSADRYYGVMVYAHGNII
ncbi:MAG TPA: hypothetical protein PLI53_08335 [Geobacteraceae bacterium]|nr:hypothetical protein [Geobacteraceae bacterium]